MGSEIQVGDRVRSFDFPERGMELEGDRACYVEGVVSDIRPLDGCDRYVLIARRAVFGGKEEIYDRPRLFYPPVNGTHTFTGGITFGVVKI